MNYLFVMAHPDDEADVGGTISKLTQEGHNVAVAIMVGKAEARRDLSGTLRKEEAKSMDILGVQKVYRADFPNIKMNTIPHLELVRFIESCIEDWKGEAIVTHHSADVNIDHALTSTAAIKASRLFLRLKFIPKLRLFLMSETAGATEWSVDSSKNRFIPNYFVEIGEEGLKKKVRAHEEYRGVMRAYPHPQSYEVYIGLAAYRGAQAGVKYAEAFECVFRSE